MIYHVYKYHTVSGNRPNLASITLPTATKELDDWWVNCDLFHFNTTYRTELKSIFIIFISFQWLLTRKAIVGCNKQLLPTNQMSSCVSSFLLLKFKCDYPFKRYRASHFPVICSSTFALKSFATNEPRLKELQWKIEFFHVHSIIDCDPFIMGRNSWMRRPDEISSLISSRSGIGQRSVNEMNGWWLQSKLSTQRSCDRN